MRNKARNVSRNGRGHPVPKGYRTLKVGEIVRATDMYNLKGNTFPFGVTGHGFCDGPSAKTGTKVELSDGCFYYRKRIPFLNKCHHKTPKGWRRLIVGEEIQSTDIFNALCNSAPFTGPNTGCGFLSCGEWRVGIRVVKANDICAYYRPKAKS